MRAGNVAEGAADAHQVVIADQGARAADMGMEIDHDAAALDAGDGHVLDAERQGPGSRARLHGVDRARVLGLGGAADVLAARPGIS